MPNPHKALATREPSTQDVPLSARKRHAAYGSTTSVTQRFGRTDLAGGDAVPVVQPAPGNPLQERALLFVEREEAQDHARHDDLGGALGAVVAFHGDAVAE